MKTPRVLDPSQINWFKGNSTKLNYKMLFKEAEVPLDILQMEDTEALELSPEETLEQARIERDHKWRLKVEKTKDSAYKEGYEDGKTAGYMQAQYDLEKKLDTIYTMIEGGIKKWEMRQELINPGILDLAFEMAEAILGYPIKNKKIRVKLQESLQPLLERIDNQSKPVLLVAETDFEYIKLLKEEHAPKSFLKIRIETSYRPGEYRYESKDEVVIQNIKNTLSEFRKKLSIPSWE